MKRLLKQKFDAHISRERFNGNRLIIDILPILRRNREIRQLLDDISNQMSDKEFKRTISGIIRASFLIELVKHPKIETTKFETRWTSRLSMTDPRYCTFNDSLDISLDVLKKLKNDISNNTRLTVLKNYLNYPLLPYEIPLDYVERRVEGSIHTIDNFSWLWTNEAAARTIALRPAILDPAIVGDHVRVFASALDKVRVKTYLTDRVLTGEHKTNREKRWEVHPESVHFAKRSDCLAIEHELMEQICFFDGFPEDIKNKLISMHVISERPITRCPVTLEKLNYVKLSEELTNPNHGRATFQVGHLNPLKAIIEDPNVGHTALNISWISDHGNRIQGHLSLEEIRNMLKKVAINYNATGWRNPT